MFTRSGADPRQAASQGGGRGPLGASPSGGEEGQVRDHDSRHLSDGTIDLALIQYDTGADSAEALASSPDPCIHHFGVEVEDLDATRAQLEAAGCRVISDRGVVPVKFRDPRRRAGGDRARGPVHNTTSERRSAAMS